MTDQKLPGFLKTGDAASAAFSKEGRKAVTEGRNRAVAQSVSSPPDPQNLWKPELILTDQQVAEALESAEYVFAKTYAATDRPHSYTLRKNWTGAIPFENLLEHILTHGTKAEYTSAAGRKYPGVYFRINGYRYWNGPYPDGTHKRHSWLINRDKDEPSPFIRYLE